MIRKISTGHLLLSSMMHRPFSKRFPWAKTLGEKCPHQAVSLHCWNSHQFHLVLTIYPSRLMEKLKVYGERGRRERTKPTFIFLYFTFLHSHCQHLHYFFLLWATHLLTSLLRNRNIPYQPEQAELQAFPVSSNGCVHHVFIHEGGLTLHPEKHFPPAGVNGQVPSWLWVADQDHGNYRKFCFWGMWMKQKSIGCP